MSNPDLAQGSIATDRLAFGRDRSGLFVPSSVLAIAAGVSAAMWATVRTLHNEWSDIANLTYTHGYLVLAVSVCSVLRARTLLGNTLAPRPSAAVALLVVSMVWLIAYQGGLLVVHQALWPLAMWAAVITICGWTVARRCMFGFAYLYFAVPVWSLLNPALQSGTTAAMKALLPTIGVPAYFSGNTVYIPSGVFEIAGGCSGLHFFIVSLAMAAIYGEMNRDTIRMRMFLLAVAAALAVLANWIRVFTIIVAGHLTEMQHFLIQVDHYYFGWLVFATVMTAFLYYASRIPQSDTARADREEASGSGSTPGQVWLAAVLAALAIGSGPARAAHAAAHPAAATAELPRIEGAWNGPLRSTSEWQPVFPRADASMQGVYRSGEHRAELFIAYYREQRQGKELGGGNSVPGEFTRGAGPRRQIDGKFGERIVDMTSGRQWVLWDTYQVGTKRFYSPMLAQVWYGVASVSATPPSMALIIGSVCAPDCDRARRSNDEFARASGVFD